MIKETAMNYDVDWSKPIQFFDIDKCEWVDADGVIMGPNNKILTFNAYAQIAYVRKDERGAKYTSCIKVTPHTVRNKPVAC
jgi:hypothetical protein